LHKQNGPILRGELRFRELGANPEPLGDLQNQGMVGIGAQDGGIHG
jgi:hypothetical protein